MNTRITRRTALKGLGTTLALPWLESLAVAAPAAATAPPRRAAFIYVPNGVNMAEWTPKSEGKLGDLPGVLKPLEAFKDSFSVYSGLTLDKARANGDGPGDHARAMAAFLTGRQPRKTHGADIRAGMSADQHIASVVGQVTRFPSLELGIDRGGSTGNCDSGYSCAYSHNLSWRGESTPNSKEVDPKAVFERLFGGNDPKEQVQARAKRDLYNTSILDFVNEDAKGLNKTLGTADQKKLEEYLASVREVEQRIQKAKAAASAPVAKPNIPAPTGIPKDYAEHIRLMADLMVLAFQTDLTRVVTFPFANEGSNRPYKFIEVPEGHHDLSHHGSDPKKLEKIKKINTFHTEQLAYVLGKMKGTKEANGTTLLDNVMLVYGSGNGDGNRHNHDELPILLCGKGGGSVASGKHAAFPKRAETPLMNLFLAIFERMGAPANSFGDSTGTLKI
ncbi:Uncharacterized protein OS=Fimbriimonas ginsengisoli Gsoil 348 GN=OP10G_3570 PE=4 SV=1: HXXSHH [Gemmataceae bacterium]|nr:Uncharacterized protein OS=Fimbriimonas ginsengisoli Gsoil 348 GN=OP10G_3570 PE=4 SV=1: HXXSHH [Gemmataceae bacterium]VTT98600.1 Uncharacterized protein OS=Fimbriimonas ginsengisoli Gsoil 348 GN=OP10G_3570 PE=4 SV=1: HXXSHH [Gemmataceae bacterium]